ncbi:hypothetical protein ABZ383_34115 [Streptomyces sp. NPDC005900]|uniref:hypothetical protein n=1 Tax=Streptomyces sp. NPDC005900 TaxID=3154569 RepID=UPI003410607A
MHRQLRADVLATGTPYPLAITSDCSAPGAHGSPSFLAAGKPNDPLGWIMNAR